MRCNGIIRLLAGFAVAISGFGGRHASAQTGGDAALTFPQLELVSGRKLKKVVVRSYDAKSEKLLVVADGKAMVIPLAEIPLSLQSRVKALAPASGGTVNTVAGSAPTPVNPPPRPGPRTPRDPSVARPSSPAPPAVAAGTGAIEPSSRQLALHRQAARKHAERYYAFEYQLGSNAGKVTALDFDLSAPKAVPGWEGRYETGGKAFLEYFDAKGRSFRRLTSTFEVITEQKSGEELTVITLNVKS